MTRVAHIALGVAIGLITACAPPASIRPHAQINRASALASGAAGALVTADAAWPRPGWWRVLGDTQLDALVEESTAHHPDLRLAQARVEAAQFRARINGATRFPAANATADLGRERFARDTTASPPGGYTVWNNRVGVDLAWSLDVWGRHRAELASALGEVHASDAEWQAVRIALEAAVVRSYVGLWGAFRLQDAYEHLHDQAVHARNIVAARRTAGIASALDLAEADTAVATSANDLERARHDIASLRVALGALTGEGPGRGDTLARPRLSGARQAQLPAALPADLLGHRPDIVASRWRVEAAAQDIHVARTAFYPNIDLIALASLGSLSTSGGFFNFASSNGAAYRLGVAISLPLFDGGLREGEYGVSTAIYDVAVETYNNAVLDALREVTDGVTDLRELHQQVDLAEAANASADRAYTLAERGYNSGITDFLNVLAAQDTQAREQQRLITSEASELDAWARLMHAIGGGFVPSAPTPGG